MTATADASASYAAEVARLLWPEPWDAPYVTRARHRAGQPHRDAYLFPSERRPRLLVPADVPGSSSMLRRLGSGRSTVSGPVRGLLERSVQSRAFPLARWPMLRVPGRVPGADSVETHLAHHFGMPVRVGILLGTRRVNQKPVLQVFDLDGRLLGYAKVGHNELTAALVRREAAALASIGAQAPRWFRVPRLIDHGEWGGLDILVTSPLVASGGARDVSRVARVNAMLEVAALTARPTSPLRASGYWAALQREVVRLSTEPSGARLAGLAETVVRHHGEHPVRLGGWHGDWSRWNMNTCDGVVQIWDWERYDPEVPWGFDAVHYAAHAIRSGRGDLREQEKDFLRSVPEGLREMGVPPAEHDRTLSLYLVTVAARYVDALTHSATPALQRRTDWVLSLLERRCEEPRGGTRGEAT